MWNKIAGNQAPPQARQAPPQQADEEEADGEMMQGGAQDEGDQEGGDETPAAAPAAGGAAPVPGQVPPQFAHHIDPNNPIQAELVKRAGTLTPQDSQAFFSGTTVPALMVLKKLIPELGFVLDRAIEAKQQGGGGAQPPQAAAPEEEGDQQAAPAPTPAPPPQRPQQSQLYRV